MDTLICLAILILGILSGYLYCIGGRDKSNINEIVKSWYLDILPNWVFRGITRDLGCALCSCITACIIWKVQGGFEWDKLGLFALMQFWACRSYFTWINKLFKQPIDKVWYNWLCVGMVSSFKWLIVLDFNFIVLAMLVLKAVWVMYVSETEDETVIEEFARGIGIL
jgi:hypothetical protein